MHDQSTTPSLFDQPASKTCTICKVSKSLDCFYTNGCSPRTGQVYIHPHCKPCMATYRRNWSKSPAGIRNRWQGNLLSKYGLTVKQYQAMHDVQGGLCAICKKPETHKGCSKKKVRLLSVDHCHRTGKVRQLLCARCNAGIGYFNDEEDQLQAAADYLRKHRKN